MSTAVTPVKERPAWKALGQQAEQIRALQLRKLFADDPQRGNRLTASALGVYFDYSKNLITDETLRLLLQLADESGLRERIDAMFAGEKINVTERRAVLHVALRAPKGEKIVVDGEDVVPRSACGARQDGRRFRIGCAATNGAGTPASRSKTSSTSASAAAISGPVMAYEALRVLQRSQPHVPLRFEHRRHRFCRSDARFGSRRNAVHHLVENVHDARNDDQRPDGPAMVPGETERSESGGQALRGRFDQRRRKWPSSASTRPTCSSFGIGSAAAIRTIRPSACR